jgi:hypothetical protein
MEENRNPVEDLLAYCIAKEKLVQHTLFRCLPWLNSFGRAGNNEDVRLQKSIAFFPIGNSVMEPEFPIKLDD